MWRDSLNTTILANLLFPYNRYSRNSREQKTDVVCVTQVMTMFSYPLLMITLQQGFTHDLGQCIVCKLCTPQLLIVNSSRKISND